MAMAIVTGGNTIAGFPLPILLKFLIGEYTWQGAMLVYRYVIKLTAGCPPDCVG